jgi:hypothetical protein
MNHSGGLPEGGAFRLVAAGFSPREGSRGLMIFEKLIGHILSG